jgi:hypothetical protein
MANKQGDEPIVVHPCFFNSPGLPAVTDNTSCHEQAIVNDHYVFNFSFNVVLPKYIPAQRFHSESQ